MGVGGGGKGAPHTNPPSHWRWGITDTRNDMSERHGVTPREKRQESIPMRNSHAFESCIITNNTPINPETMTRPGVPT